MTEPKKSKTHNYTAGCGIQLHITETEDGMILMNCGKSGSCQSIMWQIIAQLINSVPKNKVIKIFHHYECEKAAPGSRSCFDKIARLLIQDDKKEEDNGHK